jgi:toxin-antitoxin system PIN domain toxin
VGSDTRPYLRRARQLIAIDTNILVYAHREDSPFHSAAAGCIARLAEGTAAWAIPWPCLHEFLAIVTRPRVYDPPSTIAEALNQIEAWMEIPNLVLLAEPEGYWTELRSVIAASQVTGARIHDARIAALCHQHGVRELWSADRDFSRFTEITVVNPLIR